MKKILLAFSLLAAVGSSAAVYADDMDLDALCKILCSVQMGGLLCECSASPPGNA